MAAGEESSVPDFGYSPSPTLSEVLPAGTMLARIYDYTSKWDSNAFNARQIKAADNLPEFRGRFSSVDSFANQFAVLYTATFDGSEATVVLETVDYKGLIISVGSGTRILTRDKVAGLAVAYFVLKRDMRLVDFRTRPRSRDWYGADQTVLEGHNQVATRDWAHWVRSQATSTNGIIYRSHKYGSEASGWPVVVMGDVTETHAVDLEFYDEVRLDTAEGYPLLAAIADETNLVPESPWI